MCTYCISSFMSTMKMVSGMNTQSRTSRSRTSGAAMACVCVLLCRAFRLAFGVFSTDERSAPLFFVLLEQESEGQRS